MLVLEGGGGRDREERLPAKRTDLRRHPSPYRGMRGVAGISESASGGKGPLTRDSLLTFSTDFGDVVRAQLLKTRRWPDNFLTSESKKDIMRLYEKYSSP